MGDVAREFVGVQSADFLRRWLAELAPSPGRQALAAAAALVAKNDRAGAEAALRPLLGDPEVGNAAALALGELLLDDGRADDAEAALASVDPRSPQADAADAARRRITFARDAAAFGAATPPPPRSRAIPTTSRRASRWRARTPPRSRGSPRWPSCWSWSGATASSATTARGWRCWRSSSTWGRSTRWCRITGASFRSSPDGERIPPRGPVRGCRCRRCKAVRWPPRRSCR